MSLKLPPLQSSRGLALYINLPAGVFQDIDVSGYECILTEATIGLIPGCGGAFRRKSIGGPCFKLIALKHPISTQCKNVNMF